MTLLFRFSLPKELKTIDSVCQSNREPRAAMGAALGLPGKSGGTGGVTRTWCLFIGDPPSGDRGTELLLLALAASVGSSLFRR
jgi:hypothetical protein